jgi:RHS repeat-associated protein
VTLKHAPDRYYYVKDHLGSVRLTLGEDGGIVSWNDYDPWGLALAGRSGVVGSADARYQFTSQERDNETGYDYFGARYYDARVGRFFTQDRFKEKYPGLSPYQYAVNNPVLFIDVNGDSTFVINNDDGTYTVTGGNLSGGDDDTGVFIKNPDGTVTLVGNSLTTHSFFDDEGNPVIGATISTSSNEGENFIHNEIIVGNPSLLEYMPNATGGQKYDFKTREIENRPQGMTRTQYMYRGSKYGGFIGSARDFGNIGAGIVAARNGLNWRQARLGFDGLESFQKRQFATEGNPTQKAQRVGFQIGISLRKMDQ